jgi:membrane-associated phospholipid phosphatase
MIGSARRVLRGLAGMRTPWLTDVANGIKVAGSSWGVTVLGLSAVALTMAFRRWRHLLVFLCSLFFLEIIGQWIYFGLSRPRPYGVQIIGSWGGYSAPSAPVAVLTIFLMGIAYCLIVPGRPRTYAKLGFTVLIALFCLARLYLGRRSSRRRAVRCRARRGDPGHRVPLLHPERGVPRRLPAGAAPRT